MRYAQQQLTREYIQSIKEEAGRIEDNCIDSRERDECSVYGCGGCSFRGGEGVFYAYLDRVGKVLTKAEGHESALYFNRDGVFTADPYYNEDVYRITADDKGNLSYRKV